MVSFDEISDSKNDYNLNLPRYIDSTEPEDLQDIDGHLRGGIPDGDINALDAYWQVIPGVRQQLFESAGRPGYSRLKLPISTVKSAILSHSEFTAFKTTVTKIFDQWRTTNTPDLKGFNKEGHPKALIETIAEDLLRVFRNAPLLDPYDIYQDLMDYWAEAMQDDCYLIAADGWVAKTHRVMEEVKSGKKKGEMKDKGWACDLIPKPYIVARYFAKEQAELDALQNELDAVSARLIELAEEHGGEEGALKDVSTKGDAQDAYTQALVALWNEEDKNASRAYSALMDQAEEHEKQLQNLHNHHLIRQHKGKNGKPKITAIRSQLKNSRNREEIEILGKYVEADDQCKSTKKNASKILAKVEKQYQKRLNADPLPENLVDLHATVLYLSLLDEQSVLKSKVKEADAALDKLAYDKYPRLSVDEIKTLVVDDKWFTTLAMALQGELDRISQTLATRIRQLAERYDTPLPKLVDEVTDLSARVDEHLKRMGAVWN